MHGFHGVPGVVLGRCLVVVSKRLAGKTLGDLLNHMQRVLEIGPLVCCRKRSRDDLCI